MVNLPDGIPLPMSKLPLNKVGYPVPWFVAYIDGEPDFRVIRRDGIAIAYNNNLCWVCGESMGQGLQAFVIGPMCAVNRTSAEPPCHITCARWSAKACPFLAQPKMVRRDRGIDHALVAGTMIERNPGVTLVWPTRRGVFFPFGDGSGKPDGVLFNIGDPVRDPEWYGQGRAATREEVLTSIDTGVPILRGYCDNDDDLAVLGEQVAKAMLLVPA